MTTTNLDVIAYEKSPIGMICLRRRELVSSPGTIITEITVDHELLMSSYHTDSERALSSCALERHVGDDLKVLVGGLGLGYTAQEALRSSRVAKVDVVEFLPQVVDWMRQGLVPLSAELNSDSRFEVIEGDVYAMLAEPVDRQYDLILIDVDHSPDERLGGDNASFYKPEGVRRAKEHLAPGGTLGVWSYAESSPFVDALRSVFPRVDVVPVSFDNEIAEESETNWLFLGLDA
jgi:spermidine synthase